MKEDKPEEQTNESGGEGDPANKVDDQRETVIEKKDRQTGWTWGLVEGRGPLNGMDWVGQLVWVGRVRDMDASNRQEPAAATSPTRSRQVQVKPVYRPMFPCLSGAGMNMGWAAWKRG